MKISKTRLLSTQMQSDVGNSLREKLGLGKGIVYGAQTGESAWTIIDKDGIEDGHKLVTQRGIVVYIHQQSGSAKFSKNKADETYEGELWYKQELMESFKDADEEELSTMINKYFDLIMNEELVDEPEEEQKEEKETKTTEKDIDFIDLSEVGFEEWIAKEYDIEKAVLTNNKVANFIWLWEQFKTQAFSESDREMSRPKRII